MADFVLNCNMLLAIVFLLVGFVFLVKGADIFVEGSSSIAKKFHVPSIIIGLTIVAMGTSLPEAAVSVTASLANRNTLAVSNVVGSNIFNLMVVIGMCAVLTPVAVQKSTLKKDFPFSVFCAVLLLVLGLIGPMQLGHVDGAIFLVLFALFIFSMIRSALQANREGKKAESEEIESVEEMKIMSLPKSLIFIVLGAAGIIVGGDVVVNSASNIATRLGMSQTLVGLTIVSIGTSLPELVTSVVAARKNEVDMALGNAIGSNIFNILMVLGIAGAISPMAFLTENIIDIVVLLVFSVIVWIFAWTKEKLNRREGIGMLLLYAIYVVYICMR
ncbi:MAG: calcium/sodium antiporter [Lachnospiraceae bacterium]|nr:calcium/sodium antiporter [Agathobacter sp.]MDD6445600.1 calcium/sodium antiporter [Lachnospiraceae bacterium]